MKNEQELTFNGSHVGSENESMNQMENQTPLNPNVSPDIQGNEAPNTSPFDVPTNEAQNQQNQWGSQMVQEPFNVEETVPMAATYSAVQETSPAPAQVGNLNQSSPGMSGNQAPQKSSKNKMIFISLIVAACVLFFGGIAAFIVFAGTSSSPTQSEKTENQKSEIKTEFSLGLSKNGEINFKLKDIKRDVKVSKEITKAVIYIFEIENKSKRTEQSIHLRGLTKDKAFIDSIGNYVLENTTVLEDNNCQSSDEVVIEKDEVKKVCYGFVSGINKLLVPQEDFATYKAIDIDDTEYSAKAVKKNVGETIESESEFNNVSMAVNQYKVLKTSDKKEVVALPITLTVNEDLSNLYTPYAQVLLEVEEGVFVNYGERVSDEEYQSKDDVFYGKDDKAAKKGTTLKYYESFDAKQAIRVYFVVDSFSESREEAVKTYYYEF